MLPDFCGILVYSARFYYGAKTSAIEFRISPSLEKMNCASLQSSPCPERLRLVDELEGAVGKFAHLIEAAADRADKNNPELLEACMGAASEGRLKVMEISAAMVEHELQHGCRPSALQWLTDKYSR